MPGDAEAPGPEQGLEPPATLPLSRVWVLRSQMGWWGAGPVQMLDRVGGEPAHSGIGVGRWGTRGPRGHVPPSLDSAAGAGAEPGRARLRQRLRQVPASQPVRPPPTARLRRGDRLPRPGRVLGSSKLPAPPAPNAPAPGPPGARAPHRCAPLPAPLLGPSAAGVLRGSRVGRPRRRRPRPGGAAAAAAASTAGTPALRPGPPPPRSPAPFSPPPSPPSSSVSRPLRPQRRGRGGG